MNNKNNINNNFENNTNNATILEKHSEQYYEVGEYYKSVQYILEAFDLRKKNNTLRENYYFYDEILRSLGEKFYHELEYGKALLCYEKRKELYIYLNIKNQRYLEIFQSLGDYYSIIGDYYLAEKNYKEILVIDSDSNLEPSFLAEVYNSIGKLLYDVKAYSEAESYHIKAKNIRQDLNKTSEEYAQSLNNLALIYSNTQRYDLAEENYSKSEKIMKEKGKRTKALGFILNNLGALYYKLNKYDLAESKWKEAEDIRKDMEKENPYDYAQTLFNLASLYVTTKRYDDALLLMENGIDIYNKIFPRVFSTGIESTIMNFKTKESPFIFGFLSLVNEHFSSQIRLQKGLNLKALSLVLKRKGIVTDAVSIGRKVIEKDKLDSVMNTKVQKRRNIYRLIRDILWSVTDSDKQSISFQEQIDELTHELLILELEIARQIPETDLYNIINEVNVEKIANSLPDESVLIEFFRSTIYDFTVLDEAGHPKSKADVYLVFILHSRRSKDLEMLCLEAESIDRQIFKFVNSVTAYQPNETNTEKAKAERYNQIRQEGLSLLSILLKPILKIVGSRKKLIICPDGNITKLPFGALPYSEDSHRFMIDDFYITYLNTSRDLYHRSINSGVVNNPLIAGNPDFNLINQESKIKIEQNIPFETLDNTADEVIDIAKLLRVKPLLGKDVLKEKIITYKSPRIFHIATHGFFIETGNDNVNTILEPIGHNEIIGKDNPLHKKKLINNPLLNSGLVLAGVNAFLQGSLSTSKAGNGMLTADDILDMDLSSTELVVLSACDTGLGYVISGEGVFGLQRAFKLAGTNTLIMSLWKIPDEQTKELMRKFYSLLQSGESPGKALHESQLLIKEKFPDPIFWGAFICQGNN